MGNPLHMEIAQRSVREWNRWRGKNLRVQPDLTRIDLSGRNLSGIDFRGVGLFKANLSGAILCGAILRQSILIKTNFAGADLTGAHVYGASVWDVNLERTKQNDLVVTEPGDSTVTADNLEIAQFLHLLLTNKKLRDVIDTITSKVVLILGRFNGKRKPALDHLKALCRKRGLLPVLFDFKGPGNRDMTEMVKILASLSRFIIADITSPKCIPQELQAVVPDFELPVATVILNKEKPHAMFGDFLKYPWVLPLKKYKDLLDLEKNVFPNLLSDVEVKLAEIKKRRVPVL